MLVRLDVVQRYSYALPQEGTVSIGRSGSATVGCDDALVSKVHCRIRCSCDGAVDLEDCSRNGTHVDSGLEMRRTLLQGQRTALQVADIITLSRNVQFRLESLSWERRPQNLETAAQQPANDEDRHTFLMRHEPSYKADNALIEAHLDLDVEAKRLSESLKAIISRRAELESEGLSDQKCREEQQQRAEKQLSSERNEALRSELREAESRNAALASEATELRESAGSTKAQFEAVEARVAEEMKCRADLQERLSVAEAEAEKQRVEIGSLRFALGDKGRSLARIRGTARSIADDIRHMAHELDKGLEVSMAEVTAVSAGGQPSNTSLATYAPRDLGELSLGNQVDVGNADRQASPLPGLSSTPCPSRQVEPSLTAEAYPGHRVEGSSQPIPAGVLQTVGIEVAASSESQESNSTKRRRRNARVSGQGNPVVKLEVCSDKERS